MGYLHLPARIENWRVFVVDDAVTLSKIKRAEGLTLHKTLLRFCLGNSLNIFRAVNTNHPAQNHLKDVTDRISACHQQHGSLRFHANWSNFELRNIGFAMFCLLYSLCDILINRLSMVEPLSKVTNQVDQADRAKLRIKEAWSSASSQRIGSPLDSCNPDRHRILIHSVYSRFSHLRF